MVKIISLIIHFVSIISDPYKGFKVHPLPVIEPQLLLISFDEAKYNKPLNLYLDIKIRTSPLKVLFVLIAMQLMSTFFNKGQMKT